MTCLHCTLTGGAVVRNPPASAGDAGDTVHPWARKIPWHRKLQPAPVFLPGKFHGQRILSSFGDPYSFESEVTEHAHRMLALKYLFSHSKDYQFS